MLASKRRPASTQAVSRKVEGIEPRKHVYRKDDAVRMAEGNTSATAKARVRSFLGVGDHGMRDTEATRQPGRPCRCFRRIQTTNEDEERKREYAEQPQKGREAKGWQGVGSSNSTREGG